MTDTTRLPSMDVLRGLAVMGILLMNIIGFALPQAAYFNPRAWGEQTAANDLLFSLSFILVDGKMRGLFSLLFGASMLLVMERAAMDGRDPVATHLARMGWLMAIGVAHHILLWWGDVLMIYAMVGAVATLFTPRDALGLAKIAFIAFAAHFALLLATMVPDWRLAHAAALPGAGADILTNWLATLDGMGQPGSTAITAEVALYRGPWSAIAADHLLRLPGQILYSILYFGLDTLGFMTLGMAMLKSGFLTGGWASADYRRTARHCLILGLPPMLLLAAWNWASGFATLNAFAIFLLWSFPFRIPLAVGYAALALSMIGAHIQNPMVRRIAAVGRMALSNYLATSIMMTALFYQWGGGLFGHVPRVWLYLFVPGMWAVMLLWSAPWLNRFAYGPFEWVWRSLARGKLQALRR